MKNYLCTHHVYLIFFLLAALTGYPAFSQTKDLSFEEGVCRDIGFRPKTIAFGDCVLDLLGRKDPEQSSQVGVQPDALSAEQKDRGVPSLVSRAERPNDFQLSPNVQSCIGYGFKKDTADFSQCLIQLDDAQRQAELQQRQYNLQLAQYQQEVAAYNAQQEEIRREKNRRQGEMLMRLSQGVLNSRSPSLLGNLADGFAAVNGTPIQQPVPPNPPVLQNYTVRMPNGNQVYCNYNSASGYMSCR